jgi:hypothetical protein
VVRLPSQNSDDYGVSGTAWVDNVSLLPTHHSRCSFTPEDSTINTLVKSKVNWLFDTLKSSHNSSAIFRADPLRERGPPRQDSAKK